MLALVIFVILAFALGISIAIFRNLNQNAISRIVVENVNKITKEGSSEEF